jgi:hypothetical protein
VRPQVGAALIAGSAAVVLLLGLVHLAYLVLTPRFRPRDAELEARLKVVSPVITRQTTMWKVWVGFNASHSLGLILFGLVYGDLALWHTAFLIRTSFLGVVGALFLSSFLFLAARYWFSAPLRGIALALALYVAGFAVALAD